VNQVRKKEEPEGLPNVIIAARKSVANHLIQEELKQLTTTPQLTFVIGSGRTAATP
jgi:hypothetical protein